MPKPEANLLEMLFETDTPIRRAVFCTYNFDPAYFAEVIYPELRRQQCERVLVLMDAARYQTLKAPDILDSTGRIVLERFPASQLFHPKLAVLAGNGRARGVIGSANLTRAGFEENWELFSAFNDTGWDLIPLHQWLEQVAGTADLGASAKTILKETCAELLAADVGLLPRPPLPLVWNGLQGPGLWKQLNTTTQGKALKKAVVLSPYFETPEKFDHGLLDSWLAQGLKVDLYVSTDQPNSRVPRKEIAALIKKYPGRLKIFGLQTQGRLLHGKLTAVMDSSKAWVLSGSANFTAAALKGKNVEIALLLALPRPEVEKFLKYLFAGARLIEADDLPNPSPDPDKSEGPRTGFLVSAILSLAHDNLTLQLNCPWTDLAPDAGQLCLDLGGQSLTLTASAMSAPDTIVVEPASRYLRLADGTWQTGCVTVRTTDETAQDWRLIELADGETLTDSGVVLDAPTDFASFVASLFDPRRTRPGTDGRREDEKKGPKPGSEQNFEDVEGELDSVFRLTTQLDIYFRGRMTDAYTVHRWRAAWLQMHTYFSSELGTWDATTRAFLSVRPLTLLDACLSQDRDEARRRLSEDPELSESIRSLLEASANAPDLNAPLLSAIFKPPRP